MQPLTPQQRRQLQKQSMAGNRAGYLANHPGVAKHEQMLGAPGAGGGGGKPPATAGSTAAAPPPAAGGGAGKPPGASGSTAPPKTFQSFLDTQFGTGNPFGMPADGGAGAGNVSGAASGLGNLANTATANQWYGGSPIATAEAAANQNLQTNLGDIRARFGAQGGGMSSREALAEGTATAQSNTQLGAQLAQMGIGARQGDLAAATSALGQQGNLGLGQGGLQNQQANTALNATLGAGSLNNQAAANLATQGAAQTGIGQGEQTSPNLGALLSLLSAFQSTTGTGGSKQKGSQGYYTK
jgi:hypothetical protein